MTKTVYVSLDGSGLAEAALLPGAALAARTGAELALLAAPWSTEDDHVVEKYLDFQTAVSSVPARPWFLRDQEPADAITLACESDDALLCMATHGRTGLGEAVLGSVAEAVVRRSVAPIVLIGPRFEPGWRLAESPMVLAGYDGSTQARDLAFVAGRLSAALGGRLRLEQVLRPSDVVQTPRFPAGEVESVGGPRGRTARTRRLRAVRDLRRFRPRRRAREGVRGRGLQPPGAREPWALGTGTGRARERDDACGAPCSVSRAGHRAGRPGSSRLSAARDRVTV